MPVCQDQARSWEYQWRVTTKNPLLRMREVERRGREARQEDEGFTVGGSLSAARRLIAAVRLLRDAVKGAGLADLFTEEAGESMRFRGI